MHNLLTCFLALFVFANSTLAEEFTFDQPVGQAVLLPKEVREWYRNRTNPGSCVQCSLGMCGQDQNVPAAATLLWDSEYGPKEWHGANPSRVAGYCNTRGINAWNVTGSTSLEWAKWACRNGRGCAIGCGASHFQTLFDYDPRTSHWYVCNNNSPQKIDEYSDAEFKRLHQASGPWVVILDAPPHPLPPQYVQWW